LPSYSENGVEVTDIVGSNSPVFLHTKIVYQHLKFERNTEKLINIQKSFNAIIYVVSGEFEIKNQKIVRGESLLISSVEKPSVVSTKSINKGEIIFCSAIPHKEPIYQHGPYVD